MTNKENQPISQEEVEITEHLQQQTIEAYLTVAHDLRTGMSEADIAKDLAGELDFRGINDFWYNIPILVLIGPNRFQQMSDPDYDVKTPSEDIQLRPGDPFFIDVHPRDKSTRWGNFASTGIFQPTDDQIDQVSFMKRMQEMQGKVVRSLSGENSGAQVSDAFHSLFEDEQISLLDVRGNFGHNMGRGAKADFQRSFLDSENSQTIGGMIWGVEPGGIKRVGEGKLLVARMEDCVHVPLVGEPKILGRQSLPPVEFPNR